MQIAYFDCFHGAAGDMLLASLLDGGLALTALEEALAGLGLAGYRIEHERVVSHGISGSRLRVVADTVQPARDWAAIRQLLEAATLPTWARKAVLGTFTRLARVEAAIHGVPVDAVHFHEVGALDSIIDTVGVCLGLDLLGIERVYASPLPLGRGWVQTQHGPLPVPAPATLALLAEVAAPIIAAPADSQGELLTPTAAALLAELASFSQPAMQIKRVGYGFGQKKFARLNGLRVWLGETAAGASLDRDGLCQTIPDLQHGSGGKHHQHTEPAVHVGMSSAQGDSDFVADAAHEAVVELRCNLDDASGELVAYVIELLLKAGTLDAWAIPIVMKKGRPAFQLGCLARPADVVGLAALILRETPSLGVRWQAMERLAAARDVMTASTPWGAVRLKRKLLDGVVVGAAPEYADCAALARAHDVPFAAVYAAALGETQSGLC